MVQISFVLKNNIRILKQLLSVKFKNDQKIVVGQAVLELLIKRYFARFDQ